MTDRDGDAAGAQTLGAGTIGDIRSLHLVAQIVHHLGNARHADPADADEMDCAEVGADIGHGACLALARRATAATGSAPLTRITSCMGVAPKLSTRSAKALAASGLPQFHAA